MTRKSWFLMILFLILVSPISSFETVVRTGFTGNEYVGKFSNVIHDNFTIRYGATVSTSEDTSSSYATVGIGFRKAPGGTINADMSFANDDEDDTVFMISKPYYFPLVDNVSIGLSFTLLKYSTRTEQVSFLSQTMPKLKFKLNI